MGVVPNLKEGGQGKRIRHQMITKITAGLTFVIENVAGQVKQTGFPQMLLLVETTPLLILAGLPRPLAFLRPLELPRPLEFLRPLEFSQPLEFSRPCELPRQLDFLRP